MNDLYLVLFDWSTEDDAEIETYLYRNYADAVQKFKRIIVDEMKPDQSWVGDYAFNSAGKLNDGYFHHEFVDDSTGKDLYWQVGKYSDPAIYCFLTLKNMKVL